MTETSETSRRMNPAAKVKWLAALLSGEYKQGRGTLRGMDDTYCPLGVLCDVYRQEQGGRWTMLPQKDGSAYFGFCDARSQYSTGSELTAAILEWAAYCAGTFALGTPGTTKSIADLNDSGASFVEIAELLERCL